MVDGLCECGCGGETPIAKMTDRRYGAVQGQPRRFIPGHNNAKSSVLYVVDPTTGCWEWQRAKNTGGYGWMAHTPGRSSQAHRRIYERERGPLLAGVELHHRCRNPGCVNPDHMDTVSPAEHKRIERAKLDVRDVAMIRSLLTNGVSCRKIAASFGVNPATIHDIQAGRSWR